MNNKEIVSQVKHAFGIHDWIPANPDRNDTKDYKFEMYKCKFCLLHKWQNKQTGASQTYTGP